MIELQGERLVAPDRECLALAAFILEQPACDEAFAKRAGGVRRVLLQYVVERPYVARARGSVRLAFEM